MNIAIVGGGPIGLTSAISLIHIKGRWENNLSKNYNIDIYEKRNKYTRTQFIVTGGSKGNITHNYPNDLRTKIYKSFMCHIENPVIDMDGYCYNNRDYFSDTWNKFSQIIEIKKFEKILSDYIKEKYKSNIKIIKKQFTKNDEDKYQVIIGADGIHSYVRNKIMNTKWINLKDYESYILHIKYKDSSNKKYKINKKVISDKLLKSFNLVKKQNSIWNINNGLDKKKFFEQDRFRLIRGNKNKTQFLLQISKNQYNKIKNIKKYKNLPLKIKNSILIDSFLMGSLPKELDNISINTYKSSVGHSKKYMIYKNNKLYLLIGDASMTTHIFSGEGLNVNFYPFKSSINDFFRKSENIDSIIKSYNEYMGNQFKLHIKYVSMLRYIPHKLLNKICSGIELHDIYMLLDDELDLYKYKDILDKIKKKYKNISDNDIKRELCLIFRDKILKYFTFKI